MRGKEARIHKKENTKIIVLETINIILMATKLVGSENVPKNSRVVISFIKIILAYSPIKNKAKGAPAYSTLYPETNSDSPSARSKGVRLVSAKVEMNHITKRGKHGNNNHTPNFWVEENEKSLHPPTININGSKISPNLTSYEIAWATARSAPKRAYLEFEAHPAPKMAYTESLENVIINNNDKVILTPDLFTDATLHKRIAKKKNSGGAKIKNRGLDLEGIKFSLINSFSPSAKGCKRPRGPTRLGPLRNCM
jgi:hypothetical protein